MVPVVLSNMVLLYEYVCIHFINKCTYKCTIIGTNGFEPTKYPTNAPTNAPTCQSIDYGWRCFLGDGSVFYDCTNYNANGEFNTNDGLWDFPYAVNFDDNNIISGIGADTIC